MRARNLSVRRKRSGLLPLYEGANGQALSERAVFLAQMAPGMTLVASWPSIHTLSGSLMATARKINGQPAARWSGRSTTKGVRVTRIA